MLALSRTSMRAAAVAAAATVFAACAARAADDGAIDASVRRGLEFIARGQIETGAFDSNPGKTYLGIPALCGMAFLAVGDTPLSAQNGPTILRIVDYILESAREDGYMGVKGGKMYSHCISTLFLSEVSGMVDAERQEKIAELLPKAVKIILSAQAVKKQGNNAGGWRYEPDSADSDMSCTGWAVMALRSARLNGAPVPEEAIDKAVEFMLAHHNSKTGTFGYQNDSAECDKLTGAALLCLELCGRHGTPPTLAAGRYIAGNYRKLERASRRLYGLYYAAQGLFQIGGDPWREFYAWMCDYWIPQQKEDGRWDIGEDGCPYYQTALVVLAFTVPYRQLPIYQRDETVDDEERE